MSYKKFECNMRLRTKQIFVGDICYALDDKIYDGVWGDKYHYEDGAIMTDDEKTAFAITVGTANGDGTYMGALGFYEVDAGNIGVVNMDYQHTNPSRLCLYCGKVVDLQVEDIAVVVEYSNGDIEITITDMEGELLFSELIPTDVEPEEDEDSWDEDEDSWDEDEDDF